MKKYIFFLVVFALGILQVSLFRNISFFGVNPDLLFVGVVFFAIHLNFGWAITLSVFSGLVKDMFGVNQFGISTALFPLACFFIIKLSRKISLDNYFLAAAVVFIFSFLVNLLVRAELAYFGSDFSLGNFARISILESLYNAVILPLLFSGYKKLLKR